MADSRCARVAGLALALMLGACNDEEPASMPAAPQARLPDQLSGRYAMIPANCDEVVTEDRLIVAPLRVSFHESAGEVTSVKPAGPDRWRVTLAMAGEGERWTREETMRLAPGGRSLSLGSVLWHRCAV